MGLVAFQATSQYMTAMEQDALRGFGYNPYATPLYNTLLILMSAALGISFNSIVTIWLRVQKQVCDVKVK